jgi:transcriptional regulator with GAF, ATPase, and Fis domain
MGDKLFRSDLYYRLKVFPITTAPLRDHPEDIPLLARYFTKKYRRKMGRHIEKISSQTMRTIANWSWPGNVRELETFIGRSVSLSSGTSVRAPWQKYVRLRCRRRTTPRLRRWRGRTSFKWFAAVAA